MTTVNQRPLATNYASTPLGGRTVSARPTADNLWQLNNGRLQTDFSKSGNGSVRSVEPRYPSSEPRELNDEELMMDDDGDQILVLGISRGNDVITTRWQSGNCDAAQQHPRPAAVTSSLLTTAECVGLRKTSNGLTNDKQQVLSIDCNNSDYMVTSHDDVLSPMLSPRSSVSAMSPTGRRSGIPVPTWQQGIRSKQTGSDSPSTPFNGYQQHPLTTPPVQQHVNAHASKSWPSNGNKVSEKSRPMSATTFRQQNGHVTGRSSVPATADVRTASGSNGFNRRDLTRASMFEHGSRKHKPATPGYGTPGRNQDVGQRNQSAVQNRPRSASPSDQNVFPATPLSPAANQPAGFTVARTPLQPSTRTLHSRVNVPPPLHFKESNFDATSRLSTGVDGSWTNGSRPQGGENVLLSSNRSLNTVTSYDTGAVGSSSHLARLKDASACSEISSKPSETNLWDFRVTITDIADILTNLASAEWTDRRDGLLSLQDLFRTNACIAPADLKKMTDIFTKMFHDPQKKLFVILVEVLADLFHVHADDLGYWLPIVLPRLFLKLGSADIRGSVQKKVERALEAARDTFTSDLQIEVLSSFMNDQALAQCAKTKYAVLEYLHELLLDMDTSDLVNNQALQTLILRVVLWAADPQCATDVRKEAEAVIAAMFNLNAPEFALTVTTQPKGIQEFVDRILKNHMNSTLGGDTVPQVHTPTHQSQQRRQPVTNGFSVTSPSPSSQIRSRGTPSGSSLKQATTSPNDRRSSTRSSVTPSGTPLSTGSSPGSDGFRRSVFVPQQQQQQQQQQSPSAANSASRTSRIPPPRSSFKQRNLPRPTPQQQQQQQQHADADELSPTDRSPTAGSNHDAVLSPSNGIPEPHQRSPRQQSEIVDSQPPSPPAFQTTDTLESCLYKLPAEMCINDNMDDCTRWWTSVVRTLSSNSSSCEGRRAAIRQLIDSLPTRPDSISIDGLRTILAVLMSASAVNDEVSTLANECSLMLLDSALPAVARCRLLCDIINLQQLPVNYVAIQHLRTKLDDAMMTSEFDQLLPYIVATSLTGYSHDSSAVRKASVEVLVQLYSRIGDQIWLHLQGLCDTKTSYLKTRFKRVPTTR